MFFPLRNNGPLILLRIYKRNDWRILFFPLQNDGSDIYCHGLIKQFSGLFPFCFSFLVNYSHLN